MHLKKAILVLLLSTISVSLSQNSTTYDMQLLIADLMNGYDKNIKPEGQVVVEMQVYLMQIVNVLEKDQVITLNTWITEIWYDERLTWDPANYSGIYFINLPSDLFWIPDTMILSSADSNLYLKADSSALFAIDPDGRSYFSRITNNLKSRCEMNPMWFPFDEQTCSVVLASTVLANDSIIFSDTGENTFKLFNFVDNKVWQLVGYNYTFSDTVYPGYDGIYSEIHLNIRIKRKPLFYVANLVTPAICLNIITLITYFAPYAQAMTIGMSTVLAHSLLAIRLNDYLPQSNTMPVLSVYFIICMVFSILSMVWFAASNRMKEARMLPNFVKLFAVYGLTLVLCKCQTRGKIVASFRDGQMDDDKENETLSKDELLVLLFELLNRFLFLVFFSLLLIVNLTILVFIPRTK